jgi:membrane protease YdiL (CAAX protease family)
MRLSDWLALAFAMTFPGVMSWLEFLVLPDEGGDDSSTLRLAFALGKLVQFSLPLLYLRLRDRQWRFPREFRSQGVGPGILFGLIVGAGALILYFLWLRFIPLFAGSIPGRINGWLTKFGLASPAGFIGMAVFMSILHSFLEEYYWRWFVFGQLRQSMPALGANLLSSFAFMAHHVVVLSFYMKGYFWEAALPFSLCVAGGGVVWSWMYQRYQSLCGPWLSHLLVAAALMVLGYAMLAKYW